MAEAEFEGTETVRHTTWEKIPGASLTARLRIPGGWLYVVGAQDAAVFVPYSMALEDPKCGGL